MSVVAGARNHRNRLNSPPRWTSADRRAHLILWEAVPLTSVPGNWRGNRRGDFVGMWESDRTGCRFPTPEPMITSADLRQAQPDLRPKSGHEKLRALALLEQEGFTGSLVEVKAVQEVVGLPIPGGEGDQPIPRLDKLEQR